MPIRRVFADEVGSGLHVSSVLARIRVMQRG